MTSPATTPSRSDLEALALALEGATPAPWHIQPHPWPPSIRRGPQGDEIAYAKSPYTNPSYREEERANGELIVLLRNAAASLIAAATERDALAAMLSKNEGRVKEIVDAKLLADREALTALLRDAARFVATSHPDDERGAVYARICIYLDGITSRCSGCGEKAGACQCAKLLETTPEMNECPVHCHACGLPAHWVYVNDPPLSRIACCKDHMPDESHDDGYDENNYDREGAP